MVHIPASAITLQTLQIGEIMDFTIQISKDLEKEATRLARRAAAIEADIAALIRRGIAASWQLPSESSNGAPSAYDYILNWCKGNRARFIGQHVSIGDHIVGRWRDDDQCIYLFTKTLDDLLRSGGYSVSGTLKQWRDTGLIETGHDQLRYTKQVRVLPGQFQSAARVYALRIPTPNEA